VPALKGSLTYCRLYVDGELPDDFRDRFVKAIRLRAMKPLDPDEEASERSGWCVLGEPFAVPDHGESIFFDAYLNLGLRTDRWAIPGPLLRSKVREAEAAYLQKKGRERLSRKEKTEIKELTARKLRRQLAPVTKVIDLSWSLDEGLVRFFSHAAKPLASLMELFQRTFSLTLVPEAPYTLAARLGLSNPKDEAWPALEPVSFAQEDRAS
jgi:recombination associated protein RdgC